MSRFFSNSYSALKEKTEVSNILFDKTIILHESKEFIINYFDLSELVGKKILDLNNLYDDCPTILSYYTFSKKWKNKVNSLQFIYGGLVEEIDNKINISIDSIKINDINHNKLPKELILEFISEFKKATELSFSNYECKCKYYDEVIE